MGMTTVVTQVFEGPSACQDCTRNGVPVCAHIGFTDYAWIGMVDKLVHVPGLDNAFEHVLREVEISADRKTATLTIETERPRHHDLARHLSTYGDWRAKAAVRAVHHETGEPLEEGHYDRFLTLGEAVCIGRDLYHVVSVEHPYRDPQTGVAQGTDWQVARLAPQETPEVQPAH